MIQRSPLHSGDVFCRPNGVRMIADPQAFFGSTACQTLDVAGQTETVAAA